MNVLERSVLVGGWILHKSQMGAALLRKAEERTDRAQAERQAAET